ncbi:MAG: sulfatase-like hydrolase/transferase [Bacteroidota bacterium]
MKIINEYLRREFIIIIVIGIIALSIPQKVFASGDSTSYPNIVYILADDLGYGDIAWLNKESKIPTPNIDKLGEEGMAFTDAHSGSAVCTPTRYGILTGRYSWRSRLQAGVTWGYSKPLIDDERITVASFLKEHGYSTACVGKWHLGWDWGLKDNINPEELETVKYEDIDFSKSISNGPTSVGFDYFFGIPASLDMVPYVYVENDKVVEVPSAIIEGRKNYEFYRGGYSAPSFKHEDVLPTLTEKVKDYINQHKSSKNSNPFFIYFPLSAPHTPILPTDKFKGKTGLGPYADFVYQCDWTVGEIVKTLEKNGLTDNTLIIVTSDNGCSPMANFEHLENLGHNPSYIFRGHKADIFEGGHRIPFIANWPNRIPENSVCDNTICLTDLLATVAEIVNDQLPNNAGEDSFSILSDMKRNKETTEREAIVHHSVDGLFSIRQGKWKLELCPGSGGWSPPRDQKAIDQGLPMIQLYDLSNDIGEETNLQAQYPEVVHQLTNLLEDYVAKGRSTPGKAQKNDTEIDIWKSLKRRINKNDLISVDHLGKNAKVKILNETKIKYSQSGKSVLVDGIRASSNYDDGYWAGIEGEDLEVLIDLKKKQQINSVSIGFLEDQESWIFMPVSVEVFVSDDGEVFNTIGKNKLNKPSSIKEKKIHDIITDFKQLKTRYIKVKINSIKECPQWHDGNGGKAWLFIDEIMVD